MPLKEQQLKYLVFDALQLTATEVLHLKCRQLR